MANLIARPQQPANADLRSAPISAKSTSEQLPKSGIAVPAEFDLALGQALEQAPKPDANSVAKQELATETPVATAGSQKRAAGTSLEESQAQAAGVQAPTQMPAQVPAQMPVQMPVQMQALPQTATKATRAPQAQQTQVQAHLAPTQPRHPGNFQSPAASTDLFKAVAVAGQSPVKSTSAVSKAVSSEAVSSEPSGAEFRIADALGLQEMKYEALNRGSDASGEQWNSQAEGKLNASHAAQATQKPVAVSSALSTDEFLNLRTFGAGTAQKSKAKLTLNTAELGAEGSALSATMLNRDHAASSVAAPTVEAHVTTGHMQKPLLSHDAVHQMTQHLSAMNLARHDGEMKIRLKPDHLGTLNLSVRNHGQAISIRIQAQDSESRSIIESSLNSLRDSLTQQGLTVARMEITQAPAAPQAVAQDTSMQMDLGQFRQQQSDSAFQQQSHQESLANRQYWREEESSRAATSAIPGAARARNSTQGLDLIA